VVRTAVRLAELTGADREVVEAAAWLHDIAKQEETEDHGREGSLAARQILKDSSFPQAKIEAVVDAVAKHVGLWNTKPVRPLEAAIVWDADKLTKLGATAVLHFVGYQVTRRRTDTERIINWMAELHGQEATVASLNTAPARAAGRARLQQYRAFCRQALLEFNGEDITDHTDNQRQP
jgi:uncharacterized protein